MSAPAIGARHAAGRGEHGCDLLTRPLRLLPPRCTGCGGILGNLEPAYRAAVAAAFSRALPVSAGAHVSSGAVATARAAAEAAGIAAVGVLRLCCASILRSWAGSEDSVLGGTESRPSAYAALRNTMLKPRLSGVEREVRLMSGGAAPLTRVQAAPPAAAQDDATWRII